MGTSHDVILVGGGVMGSAIAYDLLRLEPGLDVGVVEPDPTYARSSTTLSDGNIRVQFNLEENIRMSLYGLEMLDRFADEMAVDGERPEIAFRRQGNLFLVDDAGVEEAREGLALQQRLGARVEWLSPAQVGEIYPLLDLADCAGGTLGHDDGTMSPVALLMGYRKKAIAMGATYLADRVTQVTQEGGRVSGAVLASGDRLRAPVVVNTAGAWAARVAATVGIDLPVQPVKRQVTIFKSETRHEAILPLLFLPSGLYVMHEGGNVFYAGKSMADDPVTEDDFEWERSLFERRIWPELAAALPDFDRIRVTRGWAGLYEVNTLDGNAILGEWPELGGFYLANGFSGHGFQQAPAVGRYLAERILDLPPSLDLSLLGPGRILTGEPVYENRRRIV